MDEKNEESSEKNYRILHSSAQSKHSFKFKKLQN